MYMWKSKSSKYVTYSPLLTRADNQLTVLHLTEIVCCRQVWHMLMLCRLYRQKCRQLTAEMHYINPVQENNFMTSSLSSTPPPKCTLSTIRGRRTYTAGTVISVPLFKVGRKSIYFPSHFWWPDVHKMHQIAQICTYIFKIFPGVTPPNPQNWPTGEG